MGNVIFYDLLDPTNKMKVELHNMFWGVDDYIRVEIYRVNPQHHPYAGKRAVKNLSKVRRWLAKECEGEVIIKQFTSNNDLYVIAYFEVEHDASFYKLVWGGDEICNH